MMEFDTEEDQRLANELADKMFDICREYSIDQVSSAAFSVALTAVRENVVIAEQQDMLSYMLSIISSEFNTLIAETRKPADSSFH